MAGTVILIINEGVKTIIFSASPLDVQSSRQENRPRDEEKKKIWLIFLFF